MSQEDEPMVHAVAVRRAWNAASRGDTALAQAWAMIAGQLEFVPQGRPDPEPVESIQYDDGLRINPVITGPICSCRGGALAHPPGGPGCMNGKAGANGY